MCENNTCLNNVIISCFIASPKVPAFRSQRNQLNLLTVPTHAADIWDYRKIGDAHK